jgi:tRNA(Ile)-lysidine synthase
MLMRRPAKDPDRLTSRAADGHLPLSAKTLPRALSKARFSEQDIAALFSPWETAHAIVLGVSGGPDSVALMVLAADWVRGRAAPPALFAATVDHGLRKESREEAEMVARWAAALALPHAILVWQGVKPRSRIQEHAREARYTLLSEHAARVGADHIMTAHHADDQAETILFRLLRGSGISGLSGMESSSKRNGIILARPLLSCAKAELVAFCERRAQPFICDPSNDDPAYARTRLRRLSLLLAEEGLGREVLLRLGRRAARADAALVAHARGVALRVAARREPGKFEANIASLIDEPEEILLRFLADELKLIRGAKPLRFERLEALAQGLGRALRSGTPYKATLGGAALRLKCDHSLVIAREGARRRGRETQLP